MIGVPKLLALIGSAMLVLSACAPAPAAPTAAPSKPTAAPAAAPTVAPAAPAPTATAPAAKPAEQPAPTAAAAPPRLDAKVVEEFYKGKTIRVIVATTAGSTYDAWARLLARHMPKYIPGNPSMIVENMPGAGHLIGANHLYNAAPKDGSVIGTFVETQVNNQLTGGKGIEFDMAKFSWIGAVQPANVVCIARSDTPNKITDLSTIIGPNAKETIFGTTGPGTSSYDYPQMMKSVLGANIKLVSGYPGNQEVRKAIEGGEVEAYCATWEAVRRGLEPWKQAGTPPYKILIQEGEQKLTDLADVPQMRDLAKTEEDKLMFKVLSTPANFTRPYMAPPGVPLERVEALRQAFMDAFKDPELAQEAQKADLEFDPRPGAQVEAGMKEVLSTPPAAVERFTKLMMP
jgi:tripartite-type tricarboxylate transporter receptor subunit TctC